jgi:ammonium transporter Rh
MISFGAVLGKVSPTQLLFMAIVEVFGFWINFRLTMVEVGAHDVGGGMVIHTFGAYFGLAACRWVSRKEAIEHKDEKSIYSSDLFSLAGTAFLFVLWPSFQSAVAGPEGRQFMALTNTFISLCSSTIAFAAVSRLLDGKYNVVHLQNATLAGGVMMGCVGDMDMGLHGAMCSGFLAGTVSCIGYEYVTPQLNHLGIHDTCGVNNLHGMPGILSSLLAIIVVGANGNGCADCPQALKGFPGVTAAHQFYATLITIGVSIVMGTLAGMAMSAVSFVGIDLAETDLYNDAACWHMPEFVEEGHTSAGYDDKKLAAVVPTD